MMKTINEIWNYLLSTGTFGVIVVFAWMYVRPVLEQKKLHAKTLQEKEMLDVTEKLADQAVTSLAGNNDINGHEKFKIATGLVANTLADKGFKVDDKVVDHVVQSAYEKSDLSPTVDPTNEQQTGVVISND